MLLYLDQNYLSGMAKRKPAFRELEPVLRDAVRRGAVRVPESRVHRIESAARPDLRLLELLRELSGGLEARLGARTRAEAQVASARSETPWNAITPNERRNRATNGTWRRSHSRCHAATW